MSERLEVQILGVSFRINFFSIQNSKLTILRHYLHSTHPMAIPYRCVAVMAFAFLVFSGRALDPIKASNVAVPLYRDAETSPFATIKIAAFVKGHQRRGFFRIGVLPEFIFKGVELDVKNCDDIPRALGLLPNRMPHSHERPFRIVHFAVKLTNQPEPLLEADELTMVGNGVGRLRNVKTPHSKAQQFAELFWMQGQNPVIRATDGSRMQFCQ